jgi:PAS domain S-box-containing protein
MTSSYYNKIILLFILVTLGGVFSVIITEKFKNEMQESIDWVEHTHQVFAKSSQIESRIQYNIIDNHGYEVSGFSVFLEKTKAEYVGVQINLEEISSLIKDNEKQVLRVNDLKDIVKKRVLYLSKNKEWEKLDRYNLQDNLMFLKKKKDYLDKVKEIVTEIQTEESHLLLLRQQKYLKSSHEFYFSVYVLLCSVVALLFWIVFLFKRALNKKDEVKKVEENFSTLANNMSQQAWMADKDGVFWYNRRWLDYSGTTLEEMKGHGWVKVLHPDYLQRFLAKRKQGMESGKGWEDVLPLRGSDGSYRWFLSQAVPVFDNQLKVIRWFGTNTDTTILKEAEEKLVEKQRELELKVEELYKSNTELDRFVYSTSHDLRAPLKSMLGLIGIIKESLEHGSIGQMKRLEMLNNSVVKLDAFIEEILNYSRNSRVDVAQEEINFVEILEEIRNSHKFIEGTDGLKLQVEIHQKVKFISDRKRISVILNNLISNAIKYKDASKAESFITVFVECNMENVIITIEDNGIGIAEDKQEKVFEMFYRATKLSTGSGLGLYILKETLEKLEGRITLKSKLNIGTKFIIQLPNTN